MSRRNDREDDAEEEPRESAISKRPAARRPSHEEEPEEEPEDRPRRRRRRDDEEDDEGDDNYRGVSGLIPYKNGLALAAYYCGVFSLIPLLGNLLGPVALILGIMGVRYAQKNTRARGTGHAIAGIVLGSLSTLLYWGLVILFVVGMFAAGR
jgi:hypothetical protein